MIRDYQAIGRTWFLRRKKRIIPTYGQHKGVKLISTLDYKTGRILCTEEEKYPHRVFLKDADYRRGEAIDRLCVRM